MCMLVGAQINSTKSTYIQPHSNFDSNDGWGGGGSDTTVHLSNAKIEECCEKGINNNTSLKF